MKITPRTFRYGFFYCAILLMIFITLNSCIGLLGAGLIDGAVKNSRFAPEKMVGLSIILDNADKVIYGSKRELKLKGTILHKTRKFVYMAEKGEKKKFRISDFDVSVTGGVYEDGFIKIHRKLKFVPDGKVIIKASYKLKANIDTTIVIDIISNKKSSIYFSGPYGGGGYHGSSGSYGSGSSSGCKDGGYGGYGGNGGNGGDGPDVEVYVKMIHSNELNKDLLAVKAINITDRDTAYDYLDPNTSSITVYANGGQGGSGGTGGSGGHGGSVTVNGSTTTRCRGGDGGDGGDGGNGGRGGRITVYADPNVNMNAIKIYFENNGGAGGYGGNGGSGGYNGGSSSYGQGRTGRTGRNGQSGGNGPSIQTMQKSLGDDLF